MNYLVLDFETTGLDPSFHEACQVSAVFLNQKFEKYAEFNSQIKPIYPERIDPEALKIQGKTLNELNNAPKSSDVFRALIQFSKLNIEPSIIVGHNIAFDLQFLRKLEENHIETLVRTEKYIDTCIISKIVLQSRKLIPNCKLSTLTSYYEIEHNAHNADSDANATAKLLHKLYLASPKLIEASINEGVYQYIIRSAYIIEPNSSFIKSCEKFLEKNGFLSSKQLLALANICHQ
ncbi:3'-5' exonuclease [bacterium]|nr:3'-5' exonuclease [bacterium]